jgi:Methyl-CpG binding domain
MKNVSRGKKEEPSNGKPAQDEEEAKSPGNDEDLAEEEAAAVATAETPSEDKVEEGTAGAPSNEGEGEGTENGKDAGGEDVDEEDDRKVAAGDSKEGPGKRIRGGAKGAKISASAKQEDKDEEDDLSETAATLAAVGDKGAATAEKRSTRSRNGPTSSNVLEVVHSPQADGKATTASKSFMSTLGSGGSPTIGRKVARKKVKGAASAAKSKGKPNPEVKRALKDSVVGGRKQGAGRAKSAGKAATAPGKKRKASSDEAESGQAKSPKKRVKSAKNAPESKPEWFGAPDDDLGLENFTWPNGWTKERVRRKSGATAGTMDTYWYSPGRAMRFRSKSELKRYFKAVEDNNGDEAAAHKEAVRK